jgi:hypothetical protein
MAPRDMVRSTRFSIVRPSPYLLSLLQTEPRKVRPPLYESIEAASVDQTAQYQYGSLNSPTAAVNVKVQPLPDGLFTGPVFTVI